MDPIYTFGFTLLVSILSAFATSFFAYRFYTPRVRADLQKEFESRFNERKWEAYTQFADIVYQALESTRADKIDRDMPKITRKLNEFISKLWIAGSDDVVNSVSEWLRFSREEADSDKSGVQGLVKLANILTEMRRDLGYKESEVGPKDLLSTFVTDIDKHM